MTTEVVLKKLKKVNFDKAPSEDKLCPVSLKQLERCSTQQNFQRVMNEAVLYRKTTRSKRGTVLQENYTLQEKEPQFTGKLHAPNRAVVH